MNNSESTKKVSKSNLFEVLTSVDNDVDLGNFRFVDDDGNPLVPTGIVESDSEVKVEVVFNETANLRISTSGKDRSDKGYGTNSLLEQWMDSYLDYDSYDDDMYKNHDMSEHLQSILDDLDITAGRKISEHIDEFNKIALDLANIEVKFEDEYLALLLLTSLSASYDHFVNTFLYGREALTLEDVMTPLNSKEIKERSKPKGDDGEGLYVRGRTDHRDSRKVKVIDGSRVILSGIQRDNCVYSLDGHAMACELNASVEEKDSLVQKNRLAERMNRTLMDKVRCLLIHSGLPKTFWVEATSEEEDTHEPLRYHDAVACEDTSKWKASIKEEMDSFRKNKTWELVDHPAGQKLRACIDYNEVFSLVVRHTSIRVILALTACKDYELEQLDVKMTFLHGNLEEVIYMRQPPGYEQGNKVCLLKKSLYGLKQSPRQWYRRFDEYMLSNGFKRSSYDRFVYYKSYVPGEYIYLLLYVDDMLIACKSKAEIGSTNYLLKKKFDMKELEEAKQILGIEIIRDQNRKILRVSQSGYVYNIFNNFRIDNGKSVKMPLGGHFNLSLKDCPVKDCDVERMSKVPYANTVGSLRYLMVCTRPDIAYAVSVVSRYLANPDYAKDPDKGRSITGYAFLVQGCVVSWKATLQHVVALSTTEAEYMALTEAGVIHLSRNHVFRERTKHINASLADPILDWSKISSCSYQEPWLLHKFDDDFDGEELQLLVVGYIQPEEH
nr:retrotransposon protein, putative, Ty1-copia subclass [Tanacetum cinerariifolium]